MISLVKSKCLSLMPPFIADTHEKMRFRTTAQFAGLQERKFLFLTDSGPMEISFRPMRICLLTIAAISVIAVLSVGHIHLPAISVFKSFQFPDISSERLFKEDTGQAERYAHFNDSNADNAVEIAGGSAPSRSEDASMFTQHTLSPILPHNTEMPVTPSPAHTDVIAHTEEMKGFQQGNFAENMATEPLPLSPDTHQGGHGKTADKAPLAAQSLNRSPQIDQNNSPQETLPGFAEFTDVKGLENPPLLTEQIRFHKQYQYMMTEAKIIKAFFEHFNIQLDNPPPAFTGSATANKQDLTTLYLYRDSWRKILATVPLKPPLRYYYITSPYGWRTNKKTGKRRFHYGVDLAGTWRSEMQVPSSGIVSFAGTAGGYGKIVRVEHGNGIETVYAHLSSINVRKGDYVTPEDSLGKMGNTGHSDGMHLHYEIRINGEAIDPSRFFNISHQIGVLGNVPSDISF